MDSERLQERIAEYLRALAQLQKAALQPKDEFMRDSVIQRFEFTHEQAWKMLKLRLEAEQIMVNTPRETWQQALQAGLIEDGNAWSEAQKQRNLTSHTYDEALAESVYRYVLQAGLPLFRKLAVEAETWQARH